MLEMVATMVAQAVAQAEETATAAGDGLRALALAHHAPPWAAAVALVTASWLVGERIGRVAAWVMVAGAAWVGSLALSAHRPL